MNELNSIEDMELFNNYNAYENDYYDNAYIPFFASIEDKIQLKEEFTNFIKAIGEKTLNGVAVISYALTKGIVQKTTGIDLDDIKDNIIDIQEEKINSDYLKDYNDSKDYKVKIKEKINKVCKDKTQVFIIDELDRCKPSFAMETLEIVKHFFDINNCVFIISVDKIQLQESAKAIYGNGINSEKYFSKLFDYQFNLLPINFYDAVDCSSIKNIDYLIECSTQVFNILNISLRDSKKVFNELIRKNKDWTISQSLFMLFLFILKYTDLSFYKAILNNDYAKYKKLFERDYNSELEKYNKLFSFKIGDGLTYGEILEELNVYLNEYYLYLGKKDDGSMIINGKNKDKKEIRNDIKMYVPIYDMRLTIRENIEKIIG